MLITSVPGKFFVTFLLVRVHLVLGTLGQLASCEQISCISRAQLASDSSTDRVCMVVSQTYIIKNNFGDTSLMCQT